MQRWYAAAPLIELEQTLMLATLSSTLIAAIPPTPLAAPAPGFAAWLPAIVMIAGIVVLGAIMMHVFHRRERQLKSLAAQIASDLEEARALRQQLDEVHTRASNMLSAAQRLGTRLDDRMASLDLASLKMQATRTALPRSTPTAPNRPTAAAPAPPTAAPAGTRPRSRPPSPMVTPRSVDAPAAAAAHAVGVATLEAKPSLDPLTLQVYALADSGRTPVAIARDLNEQVGKVELILALRRH
jgi:uncharacterized membrane-anchored protein YhcB (DUF1043 family)